MKNSPGALCQDLDSTFEEVTKVEKMPERKTKITRGGKNTGGGNVNTGWGKCEELASHKPATSTL